MASFRKLLSRAAILTAVTATSATLLAGLLTDTARSQVPEETYKALGIDKSASSYTRKLVMG